MRAPTKTLPSADYLRACFTYDPATGELRWKTRPREHFATTKGWAMWNARYPNAIAGSLADDGYYVVGLNNRVWGSHRIIWKLMTNDEPPESLDHHDKNRANNRWVNLRAATPTAQKWNSDVRRDSVSGRRGVRQQKGKWRAEIVANGVFRYLGFFNTEEEASEAYEAAARELHGEFYRPALR